MMYLGCRRGVCDVSGHGGHLAIPTSGRFDLCLERFDLLGRFRVSIVVKNKSGCPVFREFSRTDIYFLVVACQKQSGARYVPACTYSPRCSCDDYNLSGDNCHS